MPRGGTRRSEPSSDEELGGGRSRSVERRKLEKIAKVETKAAAEALARTRPDRTAAEVQAGCQRTLEQAWQPARG